MKYFVTAISTDSGKTVVSAILTEALQADYWKPIQCGIEIKDSDTVKGLLNNEHSVILEEKFLLKAPKSPHAAADLEGIKIRLEDFDLPFNEGNNMVIEGAGGVLVPLNESEFVIDLASKWDAEVILVANLYLGSINHTLLTVNELKARGLKVKGIIFNGPEDKYSEDIILKHSGYKCLLKVRPEKYLDSAVITKYAIELFNNWYE